MFDFTRIYGTLNEMERKSLNANQCRIILKFFLVIKCKANLVNFMADRHTKEKSKKKSRVLVSVNHLCLVLENYTKMYLNIFQLSPNTIWIRLSVLCISGIKKKLKDGQLIDLDCKCDLKRIVSSLRKKYIFLCDMLCQSSLYKTTNRKGGHAGTENMAANRLFHRCI